MALQTCYANLRKAAVSGLNQNGCNINMIIHIHITLYMHTRIHTYTQAPRVVRSGFSDPWIPTMPELALEDDTNMYNISG